MTDLQEHPTVKPEVLFVEDLLKEVSAGRIRIPRFQRPYVWRPAQMRALFDSIERGYPIGSLLLWETSEDVSSHDSMGPLPIAPVKGATTAFVLDGHQRLATLYGVLRLPADADRRADDGSWRWWVFRDLRPDAENQSGDASIEGRYAHVRRGEIPSHYLPVRSALKTRDFLNAARDLEDDDEVEEAERAANRLKSYKLSVVRVVGGTLTQAVEIFARLNSEGQKMKPDQMVSALTYREAGGEVFDLAETIDDTLEHAASSGFGGIPRDAVFRLMLVAAGEDDIQRTNWSRLARSVEPSLADEVKRSRYALRRSLSFLDKHLHVHHGRLLPYAAQLVLLAAFHLEHPETRRRTAGMGLRRWFWSTSFSGWFAGANSTQIKDSVKAMRAFARAAGKGETLPGADEPAMPYPEQFDLRSARVRTHLLAQLHTRTPLGIDGEPIDAGAELALNGPRAYRHILSRQLRGTRYHGDPCNRILLCPDESSSVRQTLVALDPDQDRDILKSHFISTETHTALCAGDYETAMRLRRQTLIDVERAFIEKWGLRVPESESGLAEIDTDDGEPDG